MSRRLAVRLPLLVALVLGTWLWRSSLFSQPRELVVLLPPGRAPAARVEVQLYSEEGELLKREERSFQGADPAESGRSVLRMEVSLRRGRYLCRAFVRDAAGTERSLSRAVELGDERTVEVELQPPGPGR
ncbi:MAG TPA: hypothetical protein VFB81_10490 [Myxococcales bacterium]|nr:hypothetical protein [Myxococcales bacterium]